MELSSWLDCLASHQEILPRAGTTGIHSYAQLHRMKAGNQNPDLHVGVSASLTSISSGYAENVLKHSRLFDFEFTHQRSHTVQNNEATCPTSTSNKDRVENGLPYSLAFLISWKRGKISFISTFFSIS